MQGNDVAYNLTPSPPSRYNSRELYQKVPVFSSSPFSFTAAVATSIRPEIAFENEDIISEGTSGDTVYFIYRGIAEIRSKHVPEACFTAIGDGCYFGDVGVFLDCKRTATVKTKTLCVMYTIKKDDLLRCLEDFPEIRDYMKLVANKRNQRVLSMNPKSGVKQDDENIVDDEDSKTELFAEHDDGMEAEDMGLGLGWQSASPPRRGSNILSTGSSLMGVGKERSGAGRDYKKSPLEQKRNLANRNDAHQRRKSRTANRRISEIQFGQRSPKAGAR